MRWRALSGWPYAVAAHGSGPALRTGRTRPASAAPALSRKRSVGRGLHSSTFQLNLSRF
jgi:hypothetical protein